MFFRCKFQVKASIEADTILAIDWMIIMQILVSESTELWVIHCLYTKLKQCTTIGWISVCYIHSLPIILMYTFEKISQKIFDFETLRYM